MTSKPTVTIGIPAYNEEANIGYLIADLLEQNQIDFELDQILVSSDASEDKTDEIVTNFNNEKVVLIKNQIREGQGARQNQIIKKCSSDILILLNADIQIKDKNVINAMAKAINNGADLVCGPLFEIEPTTFFEKIICFGSELRRNAFAKFNSGKNIFTCHGSHRAFSKRFYEQFEFKGSIAEEAYSYLTCIKNGFNYEYVNEAEVFVKLPDNPADHIKQSSRFFAVNKKLANQFDREFIDQHFKIPKQEFASEGLKLFLQKPLMAIIYAITTIYVVIKTKLGLTEKKDTWKIVASSKNLRK